jgi:hypothetical protein
MSCKKHGFGVLEVLICINGQHLSFCKVKYYSRVNSFDSYSRSPNSGPSATATFHAILFQPSSSLIVAKYQKSCDCLLGSSLLSRYSNLMQVPV